MFSLLAVAWWLPLAARGIPQFPRSVTDLEVYRDGNLPVLFLSSLSSLTNSVRFSLNSRLFIVNQAFSRRSDSRTTVGSHLPRLRLFGMLTRPRSLVHDKIVALAQGFNASDVEAQDAAKNEIVEGGFADACFSPLFFINIGRHPTLAAYENWEGLVSYCATF